jgi:hypothetical protein
VRLVHGRDEWDVQLEGHLVRIDRHGSPSELVRCGSADDARAAYHATIAARLAAGFVEATDPALDRDARLVHADELQLRGDPIGELIAVQHELAQLPASADPRHRKRVEHRIAAIMDEHHDAWFGALDRFVRKPSRKGPAVPSVEVGWQLGFAEEVTLRGTPQLAIDEAYARLRALPLSRQIRKLVVGAPEAAPADAFGPTYERLMDAMIEHGIPSRLRELVIGADDRHRRPTIRLGDLRAVIAAAPALEVLRIVGGHGQLDLASDTLRVLEVHDVVSAEVGQLDEARLPHLEELVLHARRPFVPPDVLAVFPALVHVTLDGFRSAGGTSLIDYFSAAPARRLRTLALPSCELDDRDLTIVIRHAEAFAQLARLDLRHNLFPRTLAAAAKQRVPGLRYR